MVEHLAVPGVSGAEIHEVSSLPATLEGSVRVGVYSVARPGALLSVVPGVGRFLATDGERIEFWREPSADPISVEQFLYGGVRAALIDQRGGFPLHAACLVPPGSRRAVALAGASGAGKSTLAAELVRRGWTLLGDDLTAVYPGEDAPLAWPSRGGVRLWRDAFERVGMSAEGLARIPGERDKYVLPTAVSGEPARLAAVLVLDRSQSGGLLPVVGPQRLATLMEQTYRPKYLKGLGCLQSHLQLTCSIADRVFIGCLRYTGAVTEGADLLSERVF